MRARSCRSCFRHWEESRPRMTAAAEAQGQRLYIIATADPALHEEPRLALPWLANGRLSQAEREKIEPHVRGCAACREELAFQRLLCNVLTEPDRVTYAPVPRSASCWNASTMRRPKHARQVGAARTSPTLARSRSRRWSSVNVSLWRPPGLAWAASFVLMLGFVGIFITANRSTQPLDVRWFKTHTDSAMPAPNVLHIAFYGR